MSPEQARGLKVDYRTDQFSLGLTLYEMLAGRRAFIAETAPQILAAILDTEPESIAKLNPRVPAPVRWTIERCLAKDARRRYDATSVLAAPVTVLTNVGLEHTRWLGETQREIAEEKLAAVRPGATLALGSRLAPEVLAVAERVARERGAPLRQASERDSAARLPAWGAFQQRNFALARLAAESMLLQTGEGPPDASACERAAREAAASVLVPGRLQVLDRDPPTVLDGAHNPAAVAALLESLPDVVGEQPLGLVFGVLDDKDAAGMLGPLSGRCARIWLTAPASERAVAPAALSRLARECGARRVTCEQDPARALLAAQRWARDEAGAVLACGSLYLVGELLEGLGAFDTLNGDKLPTGGALR